MKIIIKKILYIYYSFVYAVFCRKKYNILNEKETVERILKGNYSVSRYGDGEFKWIFGVKQNSFQVQSDDLSKELLDTLTNNDSKCLLGIPRAINNVKGYNFEAKFYWKRFKCKYYSKLKKILDENKEYIDASFTRPYIDFIDKTDMNNKFNNIKKIWDKRDLLIVEGENVNFGIGNDLLNNSKSIRRIICPSSNAFDFIDEIYSEIVKYYNNHLVLIALGPTASILCNRLCTKKIQSIDIGHLDVEYCWFLNGCQKKTNIVGKNVNEKNKDKSINISIDKDTIKKQIISYVGIEKGFGEINE